MAMEAAFESLGMKAAEALGWNAHLITCLKMCGALPPFSHIHSMMLWQRGSFIF
jgi:hypothetical protein